MKKLMIIGSVHTELLTYVKALPKGNEDAEILSMSQRVSGGGYRAAAVFRSLGFPCDVICDPGEGVYGDYARQEALRINLELPQGSGETGGCTYRMEDPEGNDAVFCVDGSEYHFSLAQIYDIDPDEYGAIAVYSEMLAGEDADELIEALRQIELPLYVIWGSRAQEVYNETLEALCGLSPVLILDERDAEELTGRKEKAEETAAALHEITKEAVLLVLDQGVLYSDGQDVWVAPAKARAEREVYAAYYIASQMAGVDKKNGMMFACEAGERKDPAGMKERLAGMILHR
jgi:sugar/nucleoside kinase (ribokinase family)